MMTRAIPWLADLRAERFLQTRMGAAAYAAFQRCGSVDIPIPDGVYWTLLGHTRFTLAAFRIAAGPRLRLWVINQTDGEPIGTCCVYVVDPERDLVTGEGPLLPMADQIYALWWLAGHAPRHLLAQVNYMPLPTPFAVATVMVAVTWATNTAPVANEFVQQWRVGGGTPPPGGGT